MYLNKAYRPKDIISETTSGTPFKQGGEAMTNFERIKAMSVEEMAEFIRSIYDDDFDYNLLHIDGDLIFDSDVKEWLEREDADNGR